MHTLLVCTWFFLIKGKAGEPGIAGQPGHPGMPGLQGQKVNNCLRNHVISGVWKSQAFWKPNFVYFSQITFISSD